MTTIDMRNVKKITNPSNSHTYKKVTLVDGSTETVIWKAGWTYTINIGDYVSTVRYKIGTGGWTTISASTTIEVDSGLTLYIQAYQYEQDTAQWNYTLYNGDISRTEANAGGSVTVYQTRALQQYTISTSGSGYTSTGIGTYTYGTSYTVTLTANSNYCFTSYDSGGLGSNSFTCDNVTRYRTITYTGTLTGNVTINATAENYYTYEVSDDNTHTSGSLTFNANSQTLSIEQNDLYETYYFTRSLGVNLTFNSRLTEPDYGDDDRIITGYSGEYTSSTSLGSVWLGSGTGYSYVICNKTISSNSYTNMSANDSAYGRITNNSYCTFTITNSTTSKSYTSPSTGVGPYDLYCDNSSKENNTITINNKSSSYDYSGEGTFMFEDMGVATRTLSRSTRYYYLTFENDSGNTVTVYFKIGSGSWSSYSVGGGGSRSVSTTYNGSIQVYFKYGNATSSTITRTMTSNQAVAGDCSSQSHDNYTFDNAVNISYWVNAYSYDGPGACYRSNNWQGGDVFSRSGHNFVRITRGSDVWIAEVPSSVPTSMWNSWGYHGWKVEANCVNRSGTIFFYADDTSDEDDDHLDCEVGVKNLGAWNDHSLSSGQYGDWVNHPYTTYSVWWN